MPRKEEPLSFDTSILIRIKNIHVDYPKDFNILSQRKLAEGWLRNQA